MLGRESYKRADIGKNVNAVHGGGGVRNATFDLGSPTCYCNRVGNVEEIWHAIEH